jgi:hypothetical protein
VGRRGESRAGKPAIVRKRGQAWDQPRGQHLSSGKPGHWGGLGYARRLPRGGAPARTAPPPGPRPRTGQHGGNPLQRPRELAGSRTASGHEHPGDEAKPRLDPGERSRSRHLRGSVRSALPESPRDRVRIAGEPVKLRPQDLSESEASWLLHLTEPSRRDAEDRKHNESAMAVPRCARGR